MTLQSFVNKWNGKGIDFDHAYGYQCVDLIQQYNKDFFNGSFLFGATALAIWMNYPQNLYTKIINTPTNVPQPGDILFWGYNHVAIVILADVMSLTSFDQNFPTGSLCHLQQHDYNNALGWLHPKQPVA